MKLQIFFALCLSLSATAFAANNTCAGTLYSGSYVELNIEETATYLKATLAVGENRDYVLDLDCTRTAKNFGAITCIESIPGGNKFKVIQHDSEAFVSKETETAGNDKFLGILACEK